MHTCTHRQRKYSKSIFGTPPTSFQDNWDNNGFVGESHEKVCSGGTQQPCHNEQRGGLTSCGADVAVAIDVDTSECRGEGGGGWICHLVGCAHALHSGKKQAPALGFPNPTMYLHILLKTLNTCTGDVPSVAEEQVFLVCCSQALCYDIQKGFRR